MFERTDNQLVNFVLFLVDVFLSAWWLWLPGLVVWWFEDGHRHFSGGSGGSGGSGYRHDGAGGEAGRGEGGFGGGDGGGGDGGD
ncbi:hypothetical protein [Streptomyces axinellae]|uniref:Glycine-rich protein n=1 Tax=Streptomyces axinellae TaxID=552788 RepID=A0ABN3QRX2_9ACTN